MNQEAKLLLVNSSAYKIKVERILLEQDKRHAAVVSKGVLIILHNHNRSIIALFSIVWKQ